MTMRSVQQRLERLRGGLPSEEPGARGIERVARDPQCFKLKALTIVGITAVSQILIVTFGSRVFNVEPLGVWDWLGVIAFTSSVLIFAEIVRRIRMATGQTGKE